MRIIVDTNILVSALLSPEGPPARILRLARQGRCTPFVSPAILEEYLEVLSRPKFRNSYDVKMGLLAPFYLPELCVFPEVRLTISPHAPDNRFLECAEEVRAEFLVTGNLRHFPRQYGVTRIVTPAEFLSHIAIP